MANRPPANYCHFCGERIQIKLTKACLDDLIIQMSKYPQRTVGYSHFSCFKNPPESV